MIGRLPGQTWFDSEASIHLLRAVLCCLMICIHRIACELMNRAAKTGVAHKIIGSNSMPSSSMVTRLKMTRSRAIVVAVGTKINFILCLLLRLFGSLTRRLVNLLRLVWFVQFIDVLSLEDGWNTKHVLRVANDDFSTIDFLYSAPSSCQFVGFVVFRRHVEMMMMMMMRSEKR